MTRHGKNNTASSVFTHAERMMTGHGSKKQRLTSHSMIDFDCCRLCLNHARDPRVDSHGHMFCYECILNHILNQKNDLRRQKEILKSLTIEEEVRKQETLRLIRSKVLEEFKRTQSGVSNNSAPKGLMNQNSTHQSLLDSGFSSARFEPTNQAERAALEALERELLETKRAKLPNFWLPSLTPSAPPTRPTTLDNSSSKLLRPLCQVGFRGNDGNQKAAHPIKLSDLAVVKFDIDKQSSSKICAACSKGLNKNSRLVVLRPCGHVICSNCFKTLIQRVSNPSNSKSPLTGYLPPPEELSSLSTAKDQSRDSVEQPCPFEDRCPKCESVTTSHANLEREGTGFAAGGISEARKFDLAFQG